MVVQWSVTEGVNLVFDDTFVRQIACTTALLNRTVRDISARGLNTVIEHMIDIISLEPAEIIEKTI